MALRTVRRNNGGNIPKPENHMIIRESALNPPVLGQSYAERWEGADSGVICCWLRGIEMRTQYPTLAAQAQAGELPVMPWKGGVQKPPKSKQKIGAVHYVAAWQGLRGEDLAIDLAVETQLTCTRTGVTVTFTSAIHKLLTAGAEELHEEG